MKLSKSAGIILRASPLLALMISALPGTARAQDAIAINPAGQVGIGTSEPRAQVDIQDGSRTNPENHPASVSGLYVTGSFDPDKGAEFRHSNGSQGVGIGYSTVYATGSNTDQNLGLKARGAGVVDVQSDLRISGQTQATGAMSIGTNAEPIASLDIQQDPRTDSHPTNVKGLYVTGDFAPNSGVEFRHSNGTQGVGIGYNTVYATGGNTNQDLNLQARGAGQVVVQSNLSVTGTLNGNTAPKVVPLPRLGGGRWNGTAVDANAWCFDADGCRINVLMTHANGQVRVIDQLIYIVNGRGWTRQRGGGDYDYSWSALSTMFEPWGWSWGLTYKHANWNGTNQQLPVGQIGFMSHPDVATTFIIYDY